MNAWVFDVDGVLSNLETRQVSESSLLPALITILEQGDRLTFNTGRTTVWVEERILTPLKQQLSHPSLIEHTFLSCEKGGVWQQEGHDPVIQEKLVVPISLRNKIRTIIAEEFHDSMFFDEPKQTMITIEMREDISMDYFQGRLQELKPILKKYLQEENAEDTFFLAEDRIGLDILSKDAGKDVGMQHILTWLQTIGKTPQHFYCFGDNPSDLHMGELLHDRGLAFTFVYVGTKPLHLTQFVPVITQEKFDKGTAEALEQLL